MKNTIWIIIIIILLTAMGGVYWYRTRLAEPLRLPEVPTGSALELIDRLGKIKIDTGIFEDKRFLELEPFPTPSIEGISRGKINPFSIAPESARVAQ